MISTVDFHFDIMLNFGITLHWVIWFIEEYIIILTCKSPFNIGLSSRISTEKKQTDHISYHFMAFGLPDSNGIWIARHLIVGI